MKAGKVTEGGTLIAAGSSGMAQAPSTESTQNSIKVTLAAQIANTLVRIESEDGEEIGSATISGTVTEITQEGVTTTRGMGSPGRQGGSKGLGGRGGKGAQTGGDPATQVPQQKSDS